MKRIACLFLLITSFVAVEPLFSVIGSLWTIYEIGAEFQNQPSTADLMDSITGLKDDINQVTKDVTKRIGQLYQQLLTQLPKVGQINRGLENFSKLFNRISYLYKVFERIIRTPTKRPSERELKEFSAEALGYSPTAVDATLDAIHELFIPTEIGHLNDGLLVLLAENLPSASSDTVNCNAGPPPEEQLYLLYLALLTAEVRGFMMLTFTYTLLQNVTGEDYANSMRAGRIATMTRVQEYMWQIRDIVSWTAPIYFACDPPGGYKRDITFAEFEMFESFYVVNQYSVVPDCSIFCEDIDYMVPAKEELQCVAEDPFCRVTEKCTGRIYKCESIPSGYIEMCMNVNEKIGSKRYVYYGVGGSSLGYEKDCKGNNKETSDEFMKYNKNTDRNHRCDFCRCTCLEEQPSSKFFVFNLRPQLADIENNKLVSGIKFTKTSHVVHVQIQQGVVKHGKFAADTLEWKPVDIMELDENKSPANSSKLSLYDENGNEYEENVDFTRLTHDHKDFYLDDLVAPDGYVVTGVRLNRPSFDDTAIQLEIRATPYNFSSQNVIVSDNYPSIWITPSNMTGVLPEYSTSERPVLLKKDISGYEARFDGSTKVISKPQTRIGIMLSNLDEDVRGTVFPLMDIREVAPPQSFLLQGIGLMYKQPVKTKGPGYLAFSLRSVARKRFLDIEVTIESDQ